VLLVEQKGLVAGFIGLFDQAWEAAGEITWGEGGSATAGGPSERGSQILQAMAAGTTDEAIARDLGMSVRHLRRQIAQVMTDLGATSRFEAGVKAAQRNWL
jgi:DNA-binding NarL/FixJ family response regulator